jgi:hypothetical protein
MQTLSMFSDFLVEEEVHVVAAYEDVVRQLWHNWRNLTRE